MAKRTRTNDTAPALFELETEVAASSEQAAPVEVAAETVEAETAPVSADLDSITTERVEELITSYSHDEWIDIMLAADTHTVGMSRGVAVERLHMEKRKGVKARKQAAEQARADQAAIIASAAEKLSKARSGATYRAMSDLMAELQSRRVVMTLAGKTVTVESVQWEKGEGWVSTPVATFTLAKGVYSFKLTGSKRVEKLDFVNAVQFVQDNTTKRDADIMPRGFRAVMRTHRHKNQAPSDITGNRASRAVSLEQAKGDELSAADLEKFPALAMVAGPRMTTGGHVNMQGVALTADERRTRDRDRLKVWRERKRAEKLAAQA